MKPPQDMRPCLPNTSQVEEEKHNPPYWHGKGPILCLIGRSVPGGPIERLPVGHPMARGKDNDLRNRPHKEVMISLMLYQIPNIDELSAV